MNVIESAAIGYLGRGWSVIALQPLAKKPALPSWQQYQVRPAEEAEVRKWWTAMPTANLGVVTGTASGGLLVLDVDGPEGRASLRGLTLPVTPVAETGSGYHYYFRHPGGAVANAVRVRPGLDVRADGGYVVAPPSLHASGRRYAWLDGLSPDDVALAPAPYWLVEALQVRRKAAGRTADEWAVLLAQGVEEGQRNATLASLAGLLLRHGVKPLVTLSLLLAWNDARCRPPLASDEVASVVRSIARREELRRQQGRRSHAYAR